MGRLLREIQDAISEQGPPEVGTSLTRGHTGRVSDSLTVEEQVCERLVNDWLDGSTEDVAAWGRRLVNELIAERPRHTSPPAYRARRFPDAVHPTDPLEFGPPPIPTAGRYNRAGQPALYLGRDILGLSAEMRQYVTPGERLYWARYLAVDSLSLVDLSDPEAHPALHLAFDRAERMDVDYEAAQRLADVVRELGIDGIIVPGVRGTKLHHYNNLVVFNCGGWRDWIDSSQNPEPLPP